MEYILFEVFKKNKFWFLLILVIVFSYLAILLYLTYPISELSIEKAGQLGDSFGVVNSIFSGLAFIALVITIYLQQKEISETKKELEKNSFENKFFNLLNHYNGLTDAFYDESEKLVKKIVKKSKLSKEGIINTYEKNNIGIFKTFFQTQYELLQFLEKECKKRGDKDLEELKAYANLVRGTMDDGALILLIINSQTSTYKNYKYFIEKFSLLEYLNIYYMNDIKHTIRTINLITKFNKNAFGNNTKLIEQLESIQRIDEKTINR